MTLDDFLKKYNKCPFCRSYIIQGQLCDGCKHRWPGAEGMDKFDPTEEWGERMNKEVDEWNN